MDEKVSFVLERERRRKFLRKVQKVKTRRSTTRKWSEKCKLKKKMRLIYGPTLCSLHRHLTEFTLSVQLGMHGPCLLAWGPLSCSHLSNLWSMTIPSVLFFGHAKRRYNCNDTPQLGCNLGFHYWRFSLSSNRWTWTWTICIVRIAMRRLFSWRQCQNLYWLSLASIINWRGVYQYGAAHCVAGWPPFGFNVSFHHPLVFCASF